MHLTPEFERDILKLSRAVNANLLSYKNAHAFFPSKKLKGGKVTGENCVTVAVTSKKPRSKLTSSEIIPSKLAGGVKTDVIELPRLTAGGFCGGPDNTPPHKRRTTGCPDHIYDNNTNLPYFNMPGGISIGNAGLMDGGTLGLIVRDRDTRRMVGLTCNHAVGLQPYHPGPHQPITEYILTDNSFTFILNDSTKTTSHVEGTLDGTQFPKMISGNLYKFTNESWLHDMYISTNDTKNNGGGSLHPYLNITIYDKNGDIRYSNGTGTGSPSISAGEVMYMTPETGLDQPALYYGSWVYPNIGAPLHITYMGVPPCKTSNHNNHAGVEYTDGLILDRHKSLKRNRLGHPGNIDAGSGGTGQVIIGSVDKIEPIRFCHPGNTAQPVNKIDACTIDLDTDVIQAKTGTLHLCEKPVPASSTWVGAELFKSGRTTGITPSGATILSNGTLGGNPNKCEIISTTATVSIDYCTSNTGTVQGHAIYEDVLLYELHNEWFADLGDSGSALLMKDTTDGNQTKLVGLHIASGFDDADGDDIADTPIRSYGIGCRIQNVFEILNLTNWEGTIILPMDHPCVKLDGLCYTRSTQAFVVPPTHYKVDEVFDDCTKCDND
jgi:hypothetical protein